MCKASELVRYLGKRVGQGGLKDVTGAQVFQ